VDDQAKFEVAADVVATEFDGKDAVILNLATKQYYTLNESATAIWMGIEEGRPVRGLIDRLLELFEVTEERARESVLATIASLRDRELVRPCPDPS
jgi:hypothetical protein